MAPSILIAIIKRTIDVTICRDYAVIPDPGVPCAIIEIPPDAITARARACDTFDRSGVAIVIPGHLSRHPPLPPSASASAVKSR